MGKHAAISSESAGDVISRRVLWNAIVRPHGAYKFVWRGIILSFCRTAVSVRPGKRFAVVQDVEKKLLVVARLAKHSFERASRGGVERSQERGTERFAMTETRTA